MFNVLKIKSLLENKKISKEEFAQEIGLKKQTFYNYINGTTKIPAEILPKIAKALNVQVGYFFEDGENSGQNVTNNNKIKGDNNKNNIISPVNNFGNESSQNFNIGNKEKITSKDLQIENLTEKLKNCKEQIEEYKNILSQKDLLIETILKKDN